MAKTPRNYNFTSPPKPSNTIRNYGDTSPMRRKGFVYGATPSWFNPNPKGESQENTRATAIMRHIKKTQRRIQKAEKTLASGPEKPEFPDLRRKLLRWKETVSENLVALKTIQEKINSVNQREITKFENKQAIDSEFVKLETGRIVPKRKPKVFTKEQVQGSGSYRSQDNKPLSPEVHLNKARIEAEKQFNKLVKKRRR